MTIHHGTHIHPLYFSFPITLNNKGNKGVNKDIVNRPNQIKNRQCSGWSMFKIGRMQLQYNESSMRSFVSLHAYCFHETSSLFYKEELGLIRLVMNTIANF